MLILLPLPIEEVNRLVDFDGDLEIAGPRGGVFLDFGLGNSGNFLYVGSSLGYVNVRSRYNVVIGPFVGSMDDANRTTAKSVEVGTLLKLRKSTNLRLGYNFTHVDNLDLLPDDGSTLSFTPEGRHTFRVGIVHFFRKN